MNCTVSFPIFNGFRILVQQLYRLCHANSGVYSHPLEIFVFHCSVCSPLHPSYPQRGRVLDTAESSSRASIRLSGIELRELEGTSLSLRQPPCFEKVETQSGEVTCLRSHSKNWEQNGLQHYLDRGENGAWTAVRIGAELLADFLGLDAHVGGSTAFCVFGCYDII